VREQVDHRPGQQQAQHRAHGAHDRPLQEEQPQHLATGRAHRAQDADLALLLHHRHHHHAGDAQHHHDHHHHADQQGTDGLRMERGHQLHVAFLPALHLVGQLAAQFVRQRLRAPHVAQPEVQAGGAARQAQHVLRGAQRHQHRAAIEVLHAQVDDRGHAHRVAHVAGLHGEAIAGPHAEVVRQLATNDRLARSQPRLAGDHLRAQADDAVVAVQLDPQQRDRLAGFTAQREAGTGHHGRHRRHARMRLQQRQHGLPVGHRTQPLRARLRVRDGALVAGHGHGRRDHVLRRGDAHVRLRAQGLGQRVALQAADQRGDVGDHRDAGRDADHDQHGLHPALAQEAPGDARLEAQGHHGGALTGPGSG
jgi:hypothetical protein